MEAAHRRAGRGGRRGWRAWRRSRVLAVAIGLFVALDAPGLNRIGVPAGGADGRADRAEAGRDRAARAQRRPRSRARRAGDRQRRVRHVHADERRRSAASAASEIDVQYPWIEGEAYEVGLLTATGGDDRPRDRRGDRDARRRSRLLRPDGAARALRRGHPGRDRDAVAAVAPRRRRRAGCEFLLAFTIGLLALPRRSTRRSRASTRERRARRRSAAPRSCWLGRRGGVPRARGRRSRGSRAPATEQGRVAGWAIARRCSSRSGIGLHNLGEGLAIGSAYAVGSLALGASLVVGFALHNTTEGLAIVAPVARDAAARRRAGSRCSG